MKKCIRVFSYCLLALFLVSCFEEMDFGFPKTVELSNEGGETILTGTTVIGHASIRGSGEQESKEYEQGEDASTDTNYFKLDWLKVEYNKNETWLKLTADPNTSGTRRKRTIHMTTGPHYSEITVYQN